MRKTFTLLFLLVALAAGAATITQDEARQIALQFLNKNTAAAKGQGSAAAVQLSLEGTVEGAYLFNNADGFIIVSDNDKAPQPVLGYADSGSLDIDNLPPSMVWWLSELQKDYADDWDDWDDAVDTGGDGDGAPAVVTRKDIAPMLTTQWGQSEPFYNLTPYSGSQHCVAGCVAIAMAQIMRYHQWPAQGTGSITYACKSLNTTLTRDFSQSTYDWANMKDIYYSNLTYTDAEQTSVARLCADAAYSVKMQFTATGSASLVKDVAPALYKYFGYDRTTALRGRDHYSADEWSELMYTELAAGRPVLYGGTTEKNAGHAFVLDGYRAADGYFHVNWGWYSNSDGYFLLSDLSPEKQGTGGSDGGYNYDQAAVIGIQPLQDGSVMTPEIYYGAVLSTSASSVQASKSASLTVTADLYTFDIETTTVSYGLKLVNNADATDIHYVAADTPAYVSTTIDGVVTSSFTLKGLSQFPTNSGATTTTYTVSPAFQVKGDATWHDCHYNNVSTGEATSAVTLNAAVKGKTVTFSKAGLSPITIKLTECPDTAYYNQKFRISFSIDTNGGYGEGNVQLHNRHTDKNGKVTTYDYASIMALAGKYSGAEAGYTTSFNNSSANPAEEVYTFYLTLDGELIEGTEHDVRFMKYDPTGITTTTAVTSAEAMRVYTGSGLYVGTTLDGLAPGLYIVKTADTVRKVTVK